MHIHKYCLSTANNISPTHLKCWDVPQKHTVPCTAHTVVLDSPLDKQGPKFLARSPLVHCDLTNKCDLKNEASI